MELHARLIHSEEGLRVVEVRASRGERSLGSALAEAATVQEAEDLAIARLLHRLQGEGWDEPARQQGSAAAAIPPTPSPIDATAAMEGSRAASSQPAPIVRRGVTHAPSRELRSQDADASSGPPARRPPDPGVAAAGLGEGLQRNAPAGTAEDSPPAESAAEQPRATSTAPPQRSAGERQAGPPAGPEIETEAPVGLQSDPQEEPPTDPEDWSQELTAIDLQLRRLGWNREQEGAYLQRAFGHPSRSRLTRYSDLRAYLMALEALESGSDPAMAAVPLRRSELLAQGDALLARLGWTAEQGRAFLERELQRVSRQQLSDVQLLQFNMLLEGEVLANGAGAAAPAAAPEAAQR